MKLKTGISSSFCKKVSEREFLEFMFMPETAGRNTLTGVCEVSVLESGYILGSTDKRTEVPQGGQNRGNKQFYKHWVAQSDTSLQPCQSSTPALARPSCTGRHRTNKVDIIFSL